MRRSMQLPTGTMVALLLASACHSEEVKRDPATQKTATGASASQPPPTFEEIQRRSQEQAAFFDGVFEADGPPDAAATEAEATMRTKSKMVEGTIADGGTTVVVEGPTCKATICRAQVTFASAGTRERYRSMFGGFGGAFFGKWALADIQISDLQIKYYIGLKDGQLPTPPR